MAKNGAKMTGVASLTAAVDDVADRWGTSVTYSAGSNVEYSIEVEYGTSHMAAQPYLRPAAEQTRRELPAIVNSADSLEEAVQRASLRVEQIAKEVVPVDTGRLRSSIEAKKV